MDRRIVVDADSCPVKDEIIQVANELNVEAYFVASYAHFMGDIAGAHIIYVESISQSVDLFIANFLQKGDVVVTGDYGLASMILKPHIKIISAKGLEYTHKNIDLLMEERHYSAKIRRSGGKTKGPKAFTQEDREKFVEILRKILIS